ncbi:MAG: pilus assembly protein [Planctomycetales bacterium]|nr:pilus assembly protein [Planctomycetales bacterium]
MKQLPPRVRRRRRSERRGAQLVEFAIVSMVMFPLIFAALEFVRVGMLESMAENAAYEAARHIMVAGSTKADAIARANEVMGRIGARGVLIEVEAKDKDGVFQSEIDDSTARIRVYVEVPLNKNSFALAHFTGNKTLSATSTMRFESYDGYYDGGG